MPEASSATTGATGLAPGRDSGADPDGVTAGAAGDGSPGALPGGAAPEGAPPVPSSDMRPEEVAAVDLDTDDDWLVDDEEAMAAERARRSRALGVLGAVILIPATFFFVVAALQFNASRSIRSTADRWSSEVQAMSREADTVDEREAELREEVTAADGAIVGAVEAQNRVSAVMSLYVDAMNDAVRARRGGSSTGTRRALDDEVAPQLEQLQAQVEQIRAFVDAPPGADDGGG